jgi:broad specificity phosphatase PhoE
MLQDKFKAEYVDAALQHFLHQVEDYQKREWQESMTNGGRFVEAILKALWEHAGKVVPAGKEFSAGNLIDRLAGERGLRESLRLTIPRGCRFVYDITSNRGARHDADEIEANEMDAYVVVTTCSWVLAEMVRYSQKGLDLAQAKTVVDGLMKRRYPFFEEIDGRVYVDIATTAREAALLILWHMYSRRRVSEKELMEMIVRHGFTQSNAYKAVSRIRSLTDKDYAGLRLRNTGVREVEALIERAEQAQRGGQSKRGSNRMPSSQRSLPK